MNKKVLLVSLISLAMPLALVSCQQPAASSSVSSSTSTSTPASSSSSSSQETINAPVIAATDNVISWTAVSNATKYKVYLNDADPVEVTDATYTVAFQDVIENKVKVSAVSASGLESAKSNEASVSFASKKSEAVRWTKDDGFDDWTVSGDATSSVINEGYDLGKNCSLRLVKEITEATKDLLIESRDFCGQEPEGTTGAKFQVLVDGTVIAPCGYTNDYVQLNPDASTRIPTFYDLGTYVGKTVVIRITETSGASSHCCLAKIVLDNFESTYLNGSVKKFYWGNKYAYKWDGEAGQGFVYDYLVPGDDDNYNHQSDFYFADEAVWDNIDFGEGAMLFSDNSMSRLVTITEENAFMTLDTRSFGGNYKGAVLVGGTAIAPIGSDNAYFTRDDYAAYNKDADDDCQNGVITRYNLTSFIGKTMMITVANITPDAMDGDKKFVIGSIGFNDTWVYDGEDLSWDAQTLNRGNSYANLAWDPAGVAFLYNEGINFRTQDFASGIAKHIDLSKVAAGKTVTLTATFRSFGGDDEAKIEFWVNGAKLDAEGTYPESSDESKDYPVDLSSFIGKDVDVYARIPTRNYRIVFEHVTLTVAD